MSQPQHASDCALWKNIPGSIIFAYFFSENFSHCLQHSATLTMLPFFWKFRKLVQRKVGQDCTILRKYLRKYEHVTKIEPYCAMLRCAKLHYHALYCEWLLNIVLFAVLFDVFAPIFPIFAHFFLLFKQCSFSHSNSAECPIYCNFDKENDFLPKLPLAIFGNTALYCTILHRFSPPEISAVAHMRRDFPRKYYLLNKHVEITPNTMMVLRIRTWPLAWPIHREYFPNPKRAWPW